VQTMLYFKPPGARGQALHQDQYYLKVQPGTCMAAWMALDDCDEANGCMQVVAGSHNWDVQCTVPADTTQSFTDITVPLPEGVTPVPVIMKAGDVMFFNGQLVHGSFANTTTDRFRRSLIGHYIVGEAEKVSQFYHPALHMDGSPVELDVSEGGGSCGVWVERGGERVIEMDGVSNALADDHE
jgi:phytanoyl-CoA hydroxylase